MKQKLLKSFLLAVTLLVGTSAWGDNYILYSQDFDSETGVPTGWTRENGTLSLETSGGNKWLRETTSGTGSRTAWYKGTAIKDAISTLTSYVLEFDCLIKEGTNTTNYCQGVWVTGSDLSQSWGTPTYYAIGVKKGSNETTYTIQANGASTEETVNLTSNTWYHYVCAYNHSTKKITFSILSQDKSSTIYAAHEFDYDYSAEKKGVFQSIHFQSGRGSGYTEIDNILLTTTYKELYSAAKAPYDTKVASLDAAGQSYWTANVTSSASVTDEASYNTAVAALPTTYIAAVKAQTTAGSNMTDALKTAVETASWTGATGTYNDVAVERYAGNTSHFSTGNILYQAVSGLHAGYYKVKFYGVANRARNIAEDYYGAGIAQMYANSETLDVDVIDQDVCSPISDTYLREFELYLAEDNSSIEFGIKNIKEGGQWYVAQAHSLIYLGAEKNDYTINAVAGGATIKELATGSVWASENYGTYVPYVIEKDSKFYVLDDNSTYYKSFTMGATDETKEVSYTLDESIVYFAEANSIYGGHSSYGTYSNDSKYSMGNGVGCYTDAYITTSSTLAPGTYNIMLGCVVRNGNKTQPYGISYSTDKENWTTTGVSISYSGTAENVYTPSANVQLASTSYLRLINNYGGNAQDYLDYVLIRNFSAETSAFNALKVYADALVAVPNDNASANSTFSTAISTQAAAVAAATTAEAITTATSTLLTAMNTYVAAANPTLGNQFDLTYLLTDPNGETYTVWGAAGDFGYYTDIPTSGVGTYNNFVTRVTSEESWEQSKNAVERYTSDVYATANTWALYQKVTLPVGKYSFDGYALANNASTIVMAAGDAEGDAVTATNLTAYTVDFTLASEAETKMGLKISATGTNACNWMAITEIKLYKEALSVSGIIPSSGYGSLASAYGLDFSSATVSSGTLTAYVVTSTATDKVTLTSVDELPANQGVILKGTPGATYNIPVKADAAYAGANLLSAAVTATDIAANTAYILQGGKLHLVTAASTVPAGKAYLLASNVPSGARSMTFVFDDEATAVFDLNDKSEMINNNWYDLQGRRVDGSRLNSGIYIKNGKKVVVK